MNRAAPRQRAARRAAAGALAALAVAAGACRRGDALRVTELSARDRTAPASGAVAVGDAALGELAAEAIKSDHLDVRLGGDGGYRAEAEARLWAAEVAGSGVLRAWVFIRLSPRGGTAGAPIESAGVIERSYAASEATDRAALSRDHLRRALADVAGPLRAAARFRVGPERAVRAALSGGEPSERVAAARAAGERRIAAAVPDLIALLASDDPELSDAATGALIAIGDRRAVRPLIDRTPFSDRERMPRTIEAVAAIGGGEAIAWLEMVAAGHDDPEIARQARLALARIGRAPGDVVGPPPEEPPPAPPEPAAPRDRDRPALPGPAEQEG